MMGGMECRDGHVFADRDDLCDCGAYVRCRLAPKPARSLKSPEQVATVAVAEAGSGACHASAVRAAHADRAGIATALRACFVPGDDAKTVEHGRALLVELVTCVEEK